jgi:hypothetical protein
MLLALLVCQRAGADTYFYVDSSRSVIGDGSAASPWQDWASINWLAVSNSVSTNSVRIYFSSRATWASSAAFIPATSGVATNRQLFLIGDEVYNLTTSGAAIWQNETGGSRASLTSFNGNGGSINLNNGAKFLTIKGFNIKRPTWGCINLGTLNPTTNIYNISIYNCVLDSPVNNHGVWFGYAEGGCHDITVSGCTISNTMYEPIYMGHYSYLAPTITNVLIESNLVVNCGIGASSFHQGNINIKPGVAGAIVRYNTKFRTAVGLGGSSCGVFVLADGCQIYGNILFGEQADSSGDWGYGIFLSADGDAVGNGSAITSCLIYNNLIYNNSRAGIKLSATTGTPAASLSGVRIWNNTIWGNATNGIVAIASPPQNIVVQELKNNLIGNSTNGFDISFNSLASITSADRNLYWRAGGTGNSWVYGTTRTFSDWQALGFDPNGTNSAPAFETSLSAGYVLQSFRLAENSAGRNLGTPSGFFTEDVRRRTRPASAWDVGAEQQLQLLLAPQNFRILQE